MKTLIVIFYLGLISLIACKKNAAAPGPYQFEGSVLGYDMRKCASPMCGGLTISIKNDTAKNPPAFYQTNATLAQLGISENVRLPINVSLSYKPDTGILATFHYIVVTEIVVKK